MQAIKALEAEIKKREAELGLLRNALAALKRVGGTSHTAVAKTTTRKPMSAEARRKLSAKMKQLWRDKQKAAGSAKKSAKS